MVSQNEKKGPYLGKTLFLKLTLKLDSHSTWSVT